MVFIGVSVWTIHEIVSEKSASYCGFVWTVHAASEQNCLTTWNALVREVAAEYAPVGVGLVIGVLVALQGVAVIMAIYQFLTNTFTKPAIERHIAKGLQIGEERGRAEANQRWKEWLERREAAEAEGRPFDEPPPSES